MRSIICCFLPARVVVPALSLVGFVHHDAEGFSSRLEFEDELPEKRNYSKIIRPPTLAGSKLAFKSLIWIGSGVVTVLAAAV